MVTGNAAASAIGPQDPYMPHFRCPHMPTGKAAGLQTSNNQRRKPTAGRCARCPAQKHPAPSWQSASKIDLQPAWTPRPVSNYMALGRRTWESAC